MQTVPTLSPHRGPNISQLFQLQGVAWSLPELWDPALVCFAHKALVCIEVQMYLATEGILILTLKIKMPQTKHHVQDQSFVTVHMTDLLATPKPYRLCSSFIQLSHQFHTSTWKTTWQVVGNAPLHLCNCEQQVLLTDSTNARKHTTHKTSTYLWDSLIGLLVHRLMGPATGLNRSILTTSLLFSKLKCTIKCVKPGLWYFMEAQFGAGCQVKIWLCITLQL